MSVVPSEIIAYGSVNMPEADGVTVGGAIDFTRRVAFYDITPSGTVNVVSSSASDTATKVVVAGRDSTGIIQTTAAATLNGTTPVTGLGSAQVFERLLYGALSGASATGPLANPGGTAAVGDVAVYANTAVISAHTAQTGAANKTGTTPALFKLQSGDGASVAIGQIIRIKSNTGVNQLRQIVAITGYGTDVVAVNRDWGTVPDNTSTYDVYQGFLFEILPNPVTSITRLFATAAADIPGGSQRIYYEKIFVDNTNTVTGLSGVSAQIASDTPSLPSGVLLDMALDKAFNDTQTSANRQTLPTNGDSTALTFITQPAAINVIAGGGNLPASAGAASATSAQGMWLRLTVPAGSTSYKGSPLLNVTGTTT